MTVHVLAPGLLSSLQDAGRPGYAALGVGRAGAMDLPAWRLANALVGNRGDEAAIECTLRGPRLRLDVAATIAVTGAPIAARVGECRLPMWTACRLPAGSVLELGAMAAGCRSYLAVRGGFAIDPVLGSRSTDLHARLGFAGGRALRAGDTLPLGVTAALTSPGDFEICRWSIDPRPWFDATARPLALLPGAHQPWLDDASLAQLLDGRFTLDKDSNRTGARLAGPILRLREPLELISEAALPGTLQLPPSGQPIALLAEAPATGGYPRIGQVAAVDLPRLAQRRPGDTVCFHAVTLEQAMTRLAARQERLVRLLAAIARRLEHDHLQPARASQSQGAPHDA